MDDNDDPKDSKETDSLIDHESTSASECDTIIDARQFREEQEKRRNSRKRVSICDDEVIIINEVIPSAYDYEEDAEDDQGNEDNEDDRDDRDAQDDRDAHDYQDDQDENDETETKGEDYRNSEPMNDPIKKLKKKITPAPRGQYDARKEMMGRPSLAHLLIPNVMSEKRLSACSSSIRTNNESMVASASSGNTIGNQSNITSSEQELTNEPRSKFVEKIRRATRIGREIAGSVHEAGIRSLQSLRRKPPLCFIIMNKAYHKYGLKHLVLILVFMFYTAFGALVFLVIEGPKQGAMKGHWGERIRHNRTIAIEGIMKQIFNNSEFLVYIKGNTSDRLRTHFDGVFAAYESQLGIRWSEQRMEWDYWNALLFAGTICTTIGYGHIYPITNVGKVTTMVYALFGIPLMLLVLQDLGKMLTITMKYPWFQFKRIARRVLRCCTKQSLKEMHSIEAQERRDLEIFDLPLPVGVSLIVLWVWICSIVMTLWDKNWTLLEAFYFFFISLSTVGLGDLVPHNPRLLLTMFGFILIGLSLVSMVINLLQSKMRKTYEAGREVEPMPDSTTLGVLQVYDEPRKTLLIPDCGDNSLSRSTQTSLSLPSTKQCVLRSDGVHWVQESDYSDMKSPDEVTRLVELESGLHVCNDIGENNLENDDNFDNTYSLQSFEPEPAETDELLGDAGCEY